MNTSIRKIRENILTKTLGIGVFLGFIAYIPSVLAAYFANMWLVVVVDTLALLIVCVVVFLPAIPFPVKLSVFVGSSLLVGVAVIAAAGPLGAGYIWLLVAVVFSALFGRTRAIALTVAATVFIMLAWGIGVATGKLDHGVTPLIVIVISVSLFAACGLMAFVISRLISGILDAYEESQRLADRLAAELDSSNSMR
ncbi:MAG: hypothetical protein JXM71_06000, partial [Spirochaetales bacterium]|nr:hypothetical protein [Spirochaetales bacterium]